MKSLIGIVVFSLLLAPIALSGGGEDPYTRENSFSRFANPNLGLQDELNRSLIKDIVNESDWYVPYYNYVKPKDAAVSFSESVKITLESYGRSSSGVRLSIFDEPSWAKCKDERAKAGLISLLNSIITDDTLSDEQVVYILNIRKDIAARCDLYDRITISTNNNLPQSWIDYLQGTFAWYKDDLPRAAELFEKSAAAMDSTASDLSTYMAGRSFLVTAQENWKPWKGKEGLDLNLLAKSAKYFAMHRANNGPFSESAFGLLGRIAYLTENDEAYERNISKRLINALNQENEDTLSKIIREYLQTYKTDSLAATLGEYSQNYMSSDEASKFDQFLKFIYADELFRNGKTKTAIEIFTQLDYSATFSYLIEYAKNIGDEAFERSIINKYLEGNTRDLYLAEIEYRHKGISALLTSDNEFLVEQVATAYCDANQLKEDILNNLSGPHISQAQRVLYRHLLQQEQYQQLNLLFNTKGFELGSYDLIRTAVWQATTLDNIGKAYMNIGYFLETHEAELKFSNLGYFLENKHPDKFCQGNLRDLYRGPQFQYQAAISTFDENDNSIDEAKALSFMINCDRPGERGCWGGKPKDAEDPETLFHRLHQKYTGSKWAKETPYYY